MANSTQSEKPGPEVLATGMVTLEIDRMRGVVADNRRIDVSGGAFYTESDFSTNSAYAEMGVVREEAGAFRLIGYWFNHELLACDPDSGVIYVKDSKNTKGTLAVLTAETEGRKLRHRLLGRYSVTVTRLGSDIGRQSHT